jgi:hypothetical protein
MTRRVLVLVAVVLLGGFAMGTASAHESWNAWRSHGVFHPRTLHHYDRRVVVVPPLPLGPAVVIPVQPVPPPMLPPVIPYRHGMLHDVPPRTHVYFSFGW